MNHNHRPRFKLQNSQIKEFFICIDYKSVMTVLIQPINRVKAAGTVVLNN